MSRGNSESPDGLRSEKILSGGSALGVYKIPTSAQMFLVSSRIHIVFVRLHLGSLRLKFCCSLVYLLSIFIHGDCVLPTAVTRTPVTCRRYKHRHCAWPE